MNNLSSIFANPSPGSKLNVPQAQAWAEKALAVAQKAVKDLSGDTDEKSECESTIAVTLFNLGMLSEVRACIIRFP